MRALIPVITGLIILASCTGKGKLPSGIMSKQKMEDVMWDMMQADHFLAEYVLNKDTSLNKVSEHNKLYEKVFQIHQTSSEKFSKSFNYYRSHPAMMREVLDSLNTKKIQEIKEQIQPVVTIDSLTQKRERLGAPVSVP